MEVTTAFTFTAAEAVVAREVEFSIALRDWDGEGNRTNSIGLFGWCVPRSGKAISVEFYLDGTVIASAPLRIERPDVVNAMEREDTPLLCGFHLRLSKFVLPPRAKLELQVWKGDGKGNGTRVALGTISGLPPAAAAANYAERYQPLLLLGQGRSGTSYLMSLLSVHPEILVPGPHPYEMRQPVWLWQAAHVMSSPANITSQTKDGFEAGDPERLGYNPYRSRMWEKVAGAESAMRWQEESLPIASIDFCKRQVDEFVDHYIEGRAGRPRFIAQKMLISPARYFVRNIYADSREIILVRDFRDVWLSARSFNRKRGVLSFSRDKFPNDLAWLRGMAFTARQIRLAHANAGPRAQLVKYEDLLAEPRQTLERILHGLGVDASADRVSAIFDDAARRENSSTLSHRTSLTHNASGRWQSEMTPEEKTVASELLGEELRYFGYETG